jgi:hypothetical protein
MKLFLIFIPLILIYSKDIKIINQTLIKIEDNDEPQIEIEDILDPPNSGLYSDWVKFRFENMWFSCSITPIHNKCKLDVNSFFQIVLNSTDNYSSQAYKVYSLIYLNIKRYPNDNMRKENILESIIKYIDEIYQKSLPLTRAESDTVGNTCCRVLVWIFRLNKDLCD